MWGDDAIDVFARKVINVNLKFVCLLATISTLFFSLGKEITGIDTVMVRYDSEQSPNPTKIDLFKVNNRNTRKKSCKNILVVFTWTFIHTEMLIYSAGIYLFKVNNGKGRTMSEISSKLITKTPKTFYCLYC